MIKNKMERTLNWTLHIMNMYAIDKLVYKYLGKESVWITEFITLGSCLHILHFKMQTGSILLIAF